MDTKLSAGANLKRKRKKRKGQSPPFQKGSGQTPLGQASPSRVHEKSIDTSKRVTLALVSVGLILFFGGQILVFEGGWLPTLAGRALVVFGASAIFIPVVPKLKRWRAWQGTGLKASIFRIAVLLGVLLAVGVLAVAFLAVFNR